jgi:hypothetical protein
MLVLFQQSDVIVSYMFMYEASLMGNALGVFDAEGDFIQETISVSNLYRVSLLISFIRALNNKASTPIHFKQILGLLCGSDLL